MTTNAPTRRVNPGALSLWASAMMITALVIIQAGRVDTGHLAYADVTEAGDMVITNANAGGGEDVLVMIDQHEERVFVYGLQNRAPEMLVAENLRDLFVQAKAQAGGNR